MDYQTFGPRRRCRYFFVCSRSPTGGATGEHRWRDSTETESHSSRKKHEPCGSATRKNVIAIGTLQRHALLRPVGAPLSAVSSHSIDGRTLENETRCTGSYRVAQRQQNNLTRYPELSLTLVFAVMPHSVFQLRNWLQNYRGWLLAGCKAGCRIDCLLLSPLHS